MLGTPDNPTIPRPGRNRHSPRWMRMTFVAKAKVGKADCRCRISRVFRVSGMGRDQHLGAGKRSAGLSAEQILTQAAAIVGFPPRGDYGARGPNRPSRRLLKAAARRVIADTRAERSISRFRMSVCRQSESSFFGQQCWPGRETLYCWSGAPIAAAIRATADICGAVRVK